MKKLSLLLTTLFLLNFAVKSQSQTKPDDNFNVNDNFLKAEELLFAGKIEDAKLSFEKVLEQDNTFSKAYAGLATVYFDLDYSNKEKIYSTQINYNADKALLYDPQSDYGLSAKALYYGNLGDWETANSYLQKALKYNPNSYLALKILVPLNGDTDKEKFLEYALRAVKIDTPESRMDKFNDYLNLSNAFRYLGFFTEAETYINKALKVNPENINAVIQKSQVLTDLTGKYEPGKEILTGLFKKDSSNLTVNQYLGFTCYAMRDYASTYKYYNKLFQNRQEIKYYEFDCTRFVDVVAKMGKKKESEKYDDVLIAYAKNAEKSQSYSEILCSIGIYCINGDIKSSLKQMKLLAQQNSFPYWVIRVLKDDPLFDNVRKLTEFKELLAEMESNFHANHERIKTSMEAKGLL